MAKIEFKPAVRGSKKLRLAICGPAGSGKTFSSLMIAKGMGGRVAVIDTENGSASLYADNQDIGLPFDTLEMGPPFSPARYVMAIKAAADAGYDVVIVDSLSHAWMGEGGELEMVDNASRSKGGNKFAGWSDVRPEERKFIEAIIRSPIHIIVTMRTKTAWEVTKDEKGKAIPIKLGLKPEQKEGLEYEFDLVLDVAIDGHMASSTKDRTSLFDGTSFVPSVATGQTLLAWLNSGKAPEAPKPRTLSQGAPPPTESPKTGTRGNYKHDNNGPPATDKQLNLMVKLASEVPEIGNLAEKSVRALLAQYGGRDKYSVGHATQHIDQLKANNFAFLMDALDAQREPPKDDPFGL